jgi:hypothetical protein
MAIIIQFHKPDGFKKPEKWTPDPLRGKVIEFPRAEKRTA